LPLRRYTNQAFTPRAEARSVRRCKAPNHVPPTWFLTTLTAYSAWRAVGLLHPTTDRGFATFLASRFRCVPKEAPEVPWQFPQRGSYPPKSSPHQQPYRVAAVFGPLAVTVLSRARPSRSREPFSRPQPKPRVDARRRTPRGAKTPNPKGNGKERARRNSDAMMLRSAEADPHVTEHVQRTGAEAPKHRRAKPSPRMPAPKRQHQLGRSNHRRGRHGLTQSLRERTQPNTRMGAD